MKANSLNWILQPLFQTIIFIGLYNLTWSFLLENAYVRRDISWGILMRYLNLIFVALSVLFGVLRYLEIQSSRKLSMLFVLVFLIVCICLINFSIKRLLFVWGVSVVSVLVAYGLTQIRRGR